MGIETLPDVEESTEPPICDFTEPTTNPHATASLSFEPCRPDEKSTPTLGRSSREILEDQTKHAHLLEPSDIAALAQTDLQYVEIYYPWVSDIQESSSHPFSLEMESPIPRRDYASRGMDQTWFAKSRESPFGGYC